MITAETSHDVLHIVYDDAKASFASNVSAAEFSREEELHLGKILEYQEKRKAVVAVLVTLLLKKMLGPSQDIRLHRTEFDEGFSGRRLDTEVVTPYLRSKSFPRMSESGWLTRSFEQSHPYSFDYPGNIRPKDVKTAFLHLVDAAQRHGEDKARALLHRLFVGLLEARDKNTNLKLARPVNLSIAEVVDKLQQHHQIKIVGAAACFGDPRYFNCARQGDRSLPNVPVAVFGGAHDSGLSIVRCSTTYGLQATPEASLMLMYPIMEGDATITFELKESWNRIVAKD